MDTPDQIPAAVVAAPTPAATPAPVKDDYWAQFEGTHEATSALLQRTPGVEGQPDPQEQELNLQQQAEQLPFSELLKKQLHSNEPYAALQQRLKESVIPPDPNFKPQDHYKELELAGIDRDMYPGFDRTRSYMEFQQYKQS